MDKRTTWGPIQWDGTKRGLEKCLERFDDADVPDYAEIVVGMRSYAGCQVSARVEVYGSDADAR